MASIARLNHDTGNALLGALERCGGLTPYLANAIIGDGKVAEAAMLGAVEANFLLPLFSISIKEELSLGDLENTMNLSIDFKSDSASERIFKSERTQKGTYLTSPAFIVLSTQGDYSPYRKKFSEQKRAAEDLFPTKNIIIPNVPTTLVILETLRKRGISMCSYLLRTSSAVRIERPDFDQTLHVLIDLRFMKSNFLYRVSLYQDNRNPLAGIFPVEKRIS